MKKLIVYTHNPQDYFEGIEDDDLVSKRVAEIKDALQEIDEMTDGGYAAIIRSEDC